MILFTRHGFWDGDLLGADEEEFLIFNVENSPDVECTITVSDDDMYALGTGGLTAKDALAQDRLDVDGNIELALKLQPFVSSL
uniref:SCP2 domain-containing protein n=1 Tax=Lutzomyia longipalpis TaxID=7200 RepID=A0A1B0C8M9_LUTLO